MFDKLAAVEGRYEALAAAMSSPEVQGDANEYRKQAKALAEIEPLVMAYRDYRGVQAQLKDAQDLAAQEATIGRTKADSIELEGRVTRIRPHAVGDGCERILRGLCSAVVPREGPPGAWLLPT